MSIELFERHDITYWAIVPTTGYDNHITVWVEDAEIFFARGGGYTRQPAMQARLTLFERVVNRVLKGGDHVNLGGQGIFLWEGGRVTYTTSCGESRSFDPSDLDALLAWATAKDPEGD